MAANRKKQDEKHLKILRNLVSLPANKQCFDCNQRGPTYVNTTIGSFVCTTCSGLLRGLTPPHRVKSISMATFTPEEIESLKSRGNEYCRKVWLALYDSNHIQDTKDEQHVKDFMVAKYEKKRYYMEPSVALKNGNSHSPTPLPSSASDNFNKIQRSAVSSSSLTSPPPVSIAPPIPQAPTMNTFTTSLSAFNLSDPFGPVASTQHPRPQAHQQPHPQPKPQQQHQPQPAPVPQPSFANFDNNPIFSSTPVVTNTMTTSASFPSTIKPKPPAEDKYAALKDLDCLMKMQQETQSQSQNQNQNQTQPQPQPMQGNVGHCPTVWQCPTMPKPILGNVGHCLNSDITANGWLSSSNGTEGGNNFFNPFQTDNIKVNNGHNPFRSGLAQQIDNNISSNSNSNGSSNNCNPWGSSNPWGTATSSIPTSHSMPFPSTSWNGNLTAIPGNSSNPFL